MLPPGYAKQMLLYVDAMSYLLYFLYLLGCHQNRFIVVPNTHINFMANNNISIDKLL